MKTIGNLNELKANLQKIYEYLASRKDPEYSYAINLVKKGTCFVVIKANDSYKFYPSRFIGYTSNSMDAHLENESRDGRVTNPAISEILGSKPVPNNEFDKYYKEYCEILGFSANDRGAFGVERKYWNVITERK